MRTISVASLMWVCALVLQVDVLGQTPVGSAFTYQGYLKDDGAPASGTYYMQFRLYDAPSDGVLIVTYPEVETVPVTVQNGLFTVDVDFGFAPFSGDERYMEIEVNGVTLSPRQELTPTPYGLYAISAGDSQKVGGYTVGNGAGQVPVSNGVLCATLNADLLDGQHGAFYQNADNLNAGTLPSARVSGAYNNALSFPNGGNSFTGNGAGLTNLNASNLASGTVPDARLSVNVALLNNAQTFTGAKTFSTAPSFTAAGAPFSVTSGTLVTNLNADLLDGQTGSFYQNASNITAGTLADARLSSNVALLNNAQTFSAGKTFSAAPSFTAAGAPFNVSSSTLVTNLNADRLDGLDSTAFLQSVPVPLTLSGTSTTHIICGENACAGTIGASGVYGLASGATGKNYGVYGQNASTTYGASGVYGLATAATGYTYGVCGKSASSTDGCGVYGEATAGSGSSDGVYGHSNSTSGCGVYGEAAAASGTTCGVYGYSISTSGRGVSGWATGSSGTIYGVYGYSTIQADGYAVYANGDMGASGTKPFRIDHPDDPANKYLLHYAAESPEVINFYSGKATLDAAGEAVVELPHYFAKINTDPRYTLTAVGAPMPMLHVAEEIDEAALSAGANAEPGEAAPVCWFRIAGGVPGAKVSWEVKALRNDLWVQMRGAPVEVDKQDLEKGTYQHPELYGQPAEMGMNYDATRAERARPEPPGETERSQAPLPD